MTFRTLSSTLSRSIEAAAELDSPLGVSQDDGVAANGPALARTSAGEAFP